MRKLYSQLIGLPVLVSHSSTPAAFVRDIVLDNDSGKVLAFVVGKNRIVVPLDIERIHTAVYISEKDMILSMDEVMRVKRVVAEDTSLIGKAVFPEHKKVSLGRVVDFEIDTHSMSLTQLDVAKSFMFFHFQERLISAQKIVRIEKKKIIVKDDASIKLKEELPVRTEAYA